MTDYGDGMLTCFHCHMEPEMLDDRMDERRFRVTCAACRLSGPERPTTSEAKEAWNRIQRGLHLHHVEDWVAQCSCGIVDDGGEAACAKFEDPDPGLYCMGCQHTRECH